MRVVVASDAVGTLSSREAGEALARGWPGDQRAVLPVGSAGEGFVRAFADLTGGSLGAAAAGDAVVTSAVAGDQAALHVETGASPAAGLPLTATSRPLGEALAALLGRAPVRRVFLDLTGCPVHDGGAGLLAGLGARADVPLDAGVAGLAGLTRLDPGPARDRLGSVELVGVVPAAEVAAPLTGLRGITAARGRAAGVDPEVLLPPDASLERLARLLGPSGSPAAGAGACGGLGLAVLALGGRLTPGPAVTLTRPEVRRTLRAADLVVTGCTVLDVASRSGGVVAAVAGAAGEALAPCVVVAGTVLIGGREMRTMGVQTAYAVRAAGSGTAAFDVTAGELTATAARVARSWRW